MGEYWDYYRAVYAPALSLKAMRRALIGSSKNFLFTIATKMGHQISNKSTYYIDSAVIRNIKGVEDISYCYKIKSKRGTKFTVLTNNLGMPLDIICSAANVHDINFVLPSCKNMKEKGIEMESLIGDKGYISEKIKTFLKDKYNIDYIFPYKKKYKIEYAYNR